MLYHVWTVNKWVEGHSLAGHGLQHRYLGLKVVRAKPCNVMSEKLWPAAIHLATKSTCAFFTDLITGQDFLLHPSGNCSRSYQNKWFHAQISMADTFIAKQQHKAGRGSEKAGGKLKFARSVSQAQSVTSTTTGGAHERGSQQICGRFYCPVMQVTISNHIYWLKTRRTAYRQGLKFLAPGSLCRRTRCSK